MNASSADLPRLFDRALLRDRQSRAARQGAEAFLLDRVAEDMAERQQVVLREFNDGIDLGTPGDQVRAALTRNVRQLRAAALPVSDTEPLALASASLDLVVSALALQFVNDLPGVLAQIRRALKPDGLFLAAMIGGETLTELRQSFAAAEAEVEGGVSPRVAPFADLRDLGAPVAAGGLRAAGDGCGSHRGALRQRICPDAGSAADGRDQCAERAPPYAVAPRDIRCGWRRCMPSGLPILTDAFAPPSTLSGCRAGPRMIASRNR
jgi:SAM-dependent methyltransferase